MVYDLNMLKSFYTSYKGKMEHEEKFKGYRQAFWDVF